MALLCGLRRETEDVQPRSLLAQAGLSGEARLSKLELGQARDIDVAEMDGILSVLALTWEEFKQEMDNEQEASGVAGTLGRVNANYPSHKPSATAVLAMLFRGRDHRSYAQRTLPLQPALAG